MQTNANLSSPNAKWLQSLIELVRKGEFNEASALADYYPRTPGRGLVQFAALLGGNELAQANSVLKTVPPEMLPLLPEVLRETNLDLMRIAAGAMVDKLLELAQCLLELNLREKPESVQTAINGLIMVAESALAEDQLELGKDLLNRVLALDSSPNRLLQSAEVALLTRKPESKEWLTGFARSRIHQALDLLDNDDIENRLKALRLMAIDDQMFAAASELALQIIQRDPEVKSRVSDIFLPLIEYKVYFGDIANLLLRISPGSIAQVVQKLTTKRLETPSDPYLNKAESLLEAFDYVGSGYKSEFAEAVLTAGRATNNLEAYAKKYLVNFDFPSNIAIEAAKHMLRQRADFDLTGQLCEKALADGEHRVEALEIYLRLADLAQDTGQNKLAKQYLRRAASLATGPEELFKLRTRTNLVNQLLRLSDFESILSESGKPIEGVFYDQARDIIHAAWPFERKTALAELLTLRTRIPSAKLLSWLPLMFDETLGFNQEEFEALALKAKELPEEFQKLIGEGLAKQELVSGADKFSVGRTPNLARAYDMHPHMMLSRSSRLANTGLSKELLSKLISELEKEGGLARYERGPRLALADTTDARKIQRHTRVLFPAQCKLEEGVELHIQLTKAVPKKTRIKKKLSMHFPEGVDQIILDVQITAPAFAAQVWRKPMTVSLKENSEEIVFQLVPLEAGMQAVEIEFFYGASRIGYVIVNTEVQSRLHFDEAPNVHSMEDPIKRLTDSKVLFSQADRRTLHVSWIERESKFYYTVYSAEPGGLGEWEQPCPGVKNEIEDYLRELNAFLTEVVTYGKPKPEEWESICLNLQSTGKSLFETLIPPQLAEQVRRWRPGSRLIVSTNEQWVPWELMHDGNEFVGKKLIIARYPRLSDRHNLPETNRPPSRRRRLKKIVNVVGGDIAEAERARKLFKGLPASIVKVLQDQPISVLQKTVRDADALHLTCHGHLNPHMLQIAKERSRVLNLSPQAVKDLPLRGDALVFANACASSAPILTFGKFSNFGWEFYRRGTDIFVGTLGAVPTSYAIGFAETVYQELFRKDSKQTIGQALASAKTSAEKERNLFWLLYCVYGDPDFTLSDLRAR